MAEVILSPSVKFPCAPRYSLIGYYAEFTLICEDGIASELLTPLIAGIQPKCIYLNYILMPRFYERVDGVALLPVKLACHKWKQWVFPLRLV